MKVFRCGPQREDTGWVVAAKASSLWQRGLQNALWSVGGSPLYHRSDSLSAAFRNLDADAKVDLTHRYAELCDHYRMTPTRNTLGAVGLDPPQSGHLLLHFGADR